MNYIALSLLTLCLAQATAAADWALESSKVSYHIVHPLHKIDATSSEAKGKGLCDKIGCEFLVATPVSTFDSNNTNRDTHVQQVVGAGLHPLVTVRIKSKTNSFSDKTPMTVAVELNGKKVTREITVSVNKSETIATANGQLQLKLTEFDIELPALLGISVKDDFTVDFESQWKYK